MGALGSGWAALPARRLVARNAHAVERRRTYPVRGSVLLRLRRVAAALRLLALPVKFAPAAFSAFVAIAHAILFPEPEKGGRGKKLSGKPDGLRPGHRKNLVSLARAVLEYSPELARRVCDGTTTAGQKAMAWAMLFPEATKLRRKGSGSLPSKGQFSAARLSQARTVLEYSEPLALQVRTVLAA